VVGFTGAWHGMTSGAQSVNYFAGRKGYGPMMPGSLAIPAPNAYRCPVRHCRDACDGTCLDVGFDAVDAQSTGSLAALIAEPVESAGGVIVPPEGYWQQVKQHCRARGMLLIFDEAQTAFRLGRNFAFQHFGVEPDILTLSKTLAAGSRCRRSSPRRRSKRNATPTAFSMPLRTCLILCRRGSDLRSSMSSKRRS
jgi:2,2-dialkylglycine decarboxylase (pyruvate)